MALVEDISGFKFFFNGKQQGFDRQQISKEVKTEQKVVNELNE